MSAAPPRALVVDDDPTMRMMLQSVLARIGVQTIAVADGRSALEALASGPFELVLLDIGLPDVDGCEVCAALRLRPGGRDTPVLMLTGHDDAASVERAYDAGATDFIAKPIAWEILSHRVRYILRSSRAFAELAENRQRLAEAQTIAALGSWEWDVARNELECSDEARRLLGLAANGAPLEIEALLAAVAPDDGEVLRRRLLETSQGRQVLNLERQVVDADGAPRLLHLFGAARPGAASAVVHGAVQDITERRASEERIHHLAHHDGLTGLPNRAWLLEELRGALTRAERHGRVLAVMLLDIDQFKRINDTLGHAVGDGLLCAVAQRLGQRLRREDVLAFASPELGGVTLSRLGGDEFCIILNELDQPVSAAKAAMRVLEAFAEPFALDDEEAMISASIGIAIYPNDARDADSLLKAADTAMYHTKNEGRDGYTFYNGSMNARAVERLTLESALRHAVERDELALHYQPIVSTASGEIVGLEALLRWYHPQWGLLMPGRFIEMAEVSGLIVPLGEWVLRAACAQSRAWQDAGLKPLPVAVNVSGEQFRRPWLAASVRQALDAARLEPALLKLEITESVLMRNVETTQRSLAQARDLGVRLSIDDFGTGYSSLAYLKRLPVHELKIDRSFVADLSEDPSSVAIAEAVIRMARALSLSVVAEGVETAEQAALLRRLECPQAQGYLFSRPQPVDVITAMLGGSGSPALPARLPVGA